MVFVSDSAHDPQPNWLTRNPEFVEFIEGYETALRHMGLIDFDDMHLIAFLMNQKHQWIRNVLRTCYPALFINEYQ
ncbi:UvrD-helicase domain-containing protein [Photorhabdus khanii]|uniref:UvrD-helicase domain-containing protein n=1 Tax=Photorhabdus khanii TaxID=1004150 RepID=UPI00104CD865